MFFNNMLMTTTAVSDILHHALISAQAGIPLEAAKWDMIMVPWRIEKPLVWDATCGPETLPGQCYWSDGCHCRIGS